MVNWESQSKTPSQSLKDGHIYCILLICIAFCHVSENLALHCLFYVNMNIHLVFYVNTAHDVVLVLLIFADIYHFTYAFSQSNTEAHTHKHTCTISTQEEWRPPGTGAWLRGAERWLLLETKAVHTHTHTKKCHEKLIFTNIKKKIRAHRATSKATRLFLTK